MRCFAFALILLLLLSSAFAGEAGKVVKVYDGDTITLEKENGETARVRLYGIDAPELAQSYGHEAQADLHALLFGKQVQILVMSLDMYGRTVAVVYLGHMDVNRAMVEAGNAWCYRQYYQGTEYLQAEETARTVGIGLWSYPDPEAPWEYRRRRKAGKD